MFCIWVLYDNNILSVKMTQPKLNVTTASDSLLVEWKLMSPVSEYLCHCQVKYSMVSQCVCRLSNTWNDILDLKRYSGQDVSTNCSCLSLLTEYKFNCYCI